MVHFVYNDRACLFWNRSRILGILHSPPTSFPTYLHFQLSASCLIQVAFISPVKDVESELLRISPCQGH